MKRATIPCELSAYHLRIFLVSKCNLRCGYCNPDAVSNRGEGFADNEILELMSAAAKAGIQRVHYSGGEPTLRKSLPEIIRHGREIGYGDQVITTNGVLLADRVAKLVEAGLTRVNISLDSLDEERNTRITGRRVLQKVRDAIEASVDAFGSVKLNVVVMRENISEVRDFIDLSHKANGKIIVRFIELQSNQPVFFDNKIESQYAPISEVYDCIRELGTLQPIFVDGENPNCSYFQIEGTKASIGIIANRSRGYPCGGCRKIRVSPYGDVGVCINAEGLNLRGTSLGQKEGAIAQLLEVREALDLHRPDRQHLSDAKGFWRWGDVSKDGGVKIDIRRLGPEHGAS